MNLVIKKHTWPPTDVLHFALRICYKGLNPGEIFTGVVVRRRVLQKKAREVAFVEILDSVPFALHVSAQRLQVHAVHTLNSLEVTTSLTLQTFRWMLSLGGSKRVGRNVNFTLGRRIFQILPHFKLGRFSLKTFRPK